MEPRRDLIEWRGVPHLSKGEPLPLIPPGYVLLRVLYAAWTGVEEAARCQRVLPQRGIVMGFTGAGRPLEAASAAAPPYLLAAPVKVTDSWLPGIWSDGWLAGYTVAPLEVLEEAPASPLAALSLPFSLACHVVSLMEEEGASSLLVLGGGASGHAAAVLASSLGFRTVLYTRKKLRCHTACAVQGSVPSTGFDTVYAAYPDAALVEDVLRRVKPRLLVLHPLVSVRLGWSTARHRVTMSRVTGLGGGCWRRLLRLYEEQYGGRYVLYTEGLMVPPPLGDEKVAYVFRLGAQPAS